MSTELAHAIKWVPWKDAGFPANKCPWKNPYEMKKHSPKPEIEKEARRLLGL